MKRLPSTLLSALLLATSAFAQSQSPAPTTPFLEEKPPEKKTPAPLKPAAPHYVSSETSAKIGANLPKFSPPKTSLSLAGRTDLPDLRDIDKPRNTIIRLPKQIVEEKLMPRSPPDSSNESYGEAIALPAYLVREAKVPNFKERELLTPYGKLQEAYRRHPGLKFNPLFFLGSNAGVAMSMLEEEYRLERMVEMKDLASLYTDSKKSADAKKLTNEAFSRTDFSSTRGP